MKTKLIPKTTLTLTLVLVTGMTIASGQNTTSQVQYRVVDLGADNGIGNDITDSHRVIGSKDYGDERHATFWSKPNSSAVDLGTLPGATQSRGFGINPRGQMAGISLGLPVFWSSSHDSPVELAGVPEDGFGVASKINPSGRIVGQIGDDTGVWPVFWAKSDTAAIFLPLVSEQFPNGAAFSINAAGRIFGDACDADFIECHCAFWAKSTSTPVILASPDDEFIYTDVGFSSDFNTADAINDLGNMVGFAINGDFSETRAVYWANNSSPALILSTTDEFPNGTAEGINDNGQIVGPAYDSEFSIHHAFFWASPNSPGIDLNTVIPAGWEMMTARSINNCGEITGGAFLDGDPIQHTVVLVPVHGQSDNQSNN